MGTVRKMGFTSMIVDRYDPVNLFEMVPKLNLDVRA
jgi:hypothetical protein